MLLGLTVLIGCINTIHGDGQVVTEPRAVVPFSSVYTEGINLQVQEGGRWEASLVGDQNLLSAVQVVQDGDEIQAYIADGAVVFPTQLTLLVTAPYLPAVEHTGGADLFFAGIDQETLQVIADGSGSTELLGAVDQLTLISSGSGIRNVQDLSARTVDVDSVASGDVWVRASESISGTLSGSGDINIFGKPAVRSVEDSGAGEIAYH
jgi:hypothetical protein